jgi:hypothetical protein
MATRLVGRLVEWDRRARQGWIESEAGTRYAVTRGAFRDPPRRGDVVTFQPIAAECGWSAKRVRGVREPVAMGAAAP